MRKHAICVLFLCALGFPSMTVKAAAIKLATPFSDHMVLQCDAPVPVWGWADAGAQVTVEFAGQKKTVAADARGKWMVRLDSMPAAAEPRVMRVSAGDAPAVVVNDVLVGEVWLGSGQSNMAMMVRNARDFEQEAAAAHWPLIRVFKEESGPAREAQAEGKGVWQICSPETVGGFSATLFFFGREIHKQLQVPVGLVVSAVGGTPIESWIAADIQRATPELRPFFDVVKKERDAIASPEAIQAYERALARWNEAVKKARAEKKPMPRKPRNPVEIAARKGDVGGLFNGKIAPLIPYALRGAVWYQGEANTLPEKAPFYATQLSLLVRDWRARWGHEFAFAWVQLAGFDAPPERNWPLVREAMLKTLALPKTGMAVAMDVGEEKDIHPKNKQEVGRRLAAWALGTVYGQKVPAVSGPLLAGHEIRGGEMALRFQHAEGGLVFRGDALKGFMVAGADQQWKPAQARIQGDTVVISSPEVTQPMAARYGWEDFSPCNLYNGAGLPASPFRTDDGDTPPSK